ncbi:hypothetical protein LIER_32746 [Lithospermum erythrorhizon]|uniref:Uncharacterized protein n=1 Tax=Lithospermum erythrorhizon TaxID=34254 RepID=A0AAV3RUQ0_LITER
MRYIGARDRRCSRGLKGSGTLLIFMQFWLREVKLISSQPYKMTKGHSIEAGRTFTKWLPPFIQSFSPLKLKATYSILDSCYLASLVQTWYTSWM